MSYGGQGNMGEMAGECRAGELAKPPPASFIGHPKSKAKGEVVSCEIKMWPRKKLHMTAQPLNILHNAYVLWCNPSIFLDFPTSLATFSPVAFLVFTVQKGGQNLGNKNRSGGVLTVV